MSLALLASSRPNWSSVAEGAGLAAGGGVGDTGLLQGGQEVGLVGRGGEDGLDHF